MINYKKELLKEKKKMIEIIKHKNKNPIMSRNITITMYLISTVILVHNGRKHVQVPINKFRLSKKLGEYSFTRTFKKHFKKKKKK